MYTITCPGGFPVPNKSGKFEVYGFCVAIADPTLISQFVLVDDPGISPNLETGRMLTTLDGQKGILANKKGVTNVDSTLEVMFAEPIKTRYGLSIYGYNWIPGSVCVYRR